MKKRFFIAFMLIFALTGSVFAQQRTITGTVTSQEDGSSLPGVNVVVKGTTIGAITNVNGTYTITVPADAQTLEFSFVGMETQEVTIGSSSSIDVTLAVSSSALEEVVVTALGISREKKALGYAMTEVSGDEISTVKETNVINSLAGRVAGVNITQSSSGPGGGTRVIIRGNNSLGGNNQPLYIVDGIPMDNSGVGGASGGGTGEYNRMDRGTGVSDLNADDIESISVLKGPNAAALYGSRAANGVIYIITKKGKSRPGIGVSFTSNIQFENPMILPKYQNKYGRGSTGLSPNDYPDLSTLKGTSSGWGGELDGSQQMYWVDDPLGSGTATMKAYSAQPDNVKDFFRTGINAVNTLAVEGGNQFINARFSYTNNVANSIMPNSGMKRHNFNLRTFIQPAEFLTVDTKITYFLQDYENRARQGTEGIMSYLFTIPRNTAINDLETYRRLPDYSSNSYRSLGANPYFLLYENTDLDSRNRIMGFVKATVEFSPWLSLFVRAGTDLTTTNVETIDAPGHHFYSQGRMSVSSRKFSETNMDFLLMFNKQVASGFNLGVNLGGNLMQQSSTSIGVSGSRFRIPTKLTVSSLGEFNGSYSPDVQKKIHSLYGNASLSYNNFIYLDVSGRNDWSSTLPENNWSYFYPSVGLSVLLQEFIDPNQGFLNFLKVRANWAQVGSDTGPYQLDVGYSISSASGSYLGLTTLSRPGTLLNVDLKPEITASTEFGFEFRLMDNRIFGDFSYYSIVTTDLIMDVPVSPSTGYSRFRSNVGKVTNKGFEFLVGGTPVMTDDFSWDISVNFSKNKNELVELIEGVDSYTFTTTNSGIVSVRATVKNDSIADSGGYGDIYGTTWQKTDDGRLVVDATGRPTSTGELVKLGNYQPDFLGGMTNTFKYKNITFSFLIDARIGGQLYAGTNASIMGSGVGEETLNRESRTLDAVVNTSGDPDNPTWEANTQEITGQQYFGAISGFAETHVYDQTNIRLRELSLLYRFPKSLFGGAIQDLTLGIVGRNLFFFMNDMPNFDPESTFSTSNFSQGVLWYNLPTARSIGFSLNVRF